MNGKTKTIIAMLVSLTLMVTMAACGSRNEAAEETVDPEAEVVTEEEYDIASNLNETVSGNSKTIETDCFTLTLSMPDTWNYEQDNSTSITFYNIAGREAGCGGRLMTLVAVDPDDDSYKGLPHYSIVGENGGKTYVAVYPSDVQADIENEEHMKQYEAVYAEVSKIEAKAADSPLVLK